MTKIASLSIIEADCSKPEGFATASVQVAIRRRVQVKCDNMVKAGTLFRATAPPRLVRYFKTMALHAAWLARQPFDNGAETRTTITTNAAQPDGFHMHDLPKERRSSAYKIALDMREKGLIFIANDKGGMRYFDTPANAAAWKTKELLRLPPPAVRLERAKAKAGPPRSGAVIVWPAGIVIKRYPTATPKNTTYYSPAVRTGMRAMSS